MGTLETLIEDRDNLLIEWFADGLDNEEILTLCEQRGFDLSLEAIQERRVFLRRRILEATASRGARILERIPRASKAVRVREIDELCEQLRRGRRWCEDHDKWPTAGRLADVELRALRLLAEEVNDIGPVKRGFNRFVWFIRQAPPDIREEVIGKMQEILALIEASGLLALEAGASATEPTAIDAEFEAADETS